MGNRFHVAKRVKEHHLARLISDGELLCVLQCLCLRGKGGSSPLKVDDIPLAVFTGYYVHRTARVDKHVPILPMRRGYWLVRCTTSTGAAWKGGSGQDWSPRSLAGTCVYAADRAYCSTVVPEPGDCTETFAVVSATPGPLAWMTALPAATLVTLTLAVD